MNAMPFVIGALAILALGYRFYFSFICAKVLMLNDSHEMPANK
jgi:carbon starvation protein CstA